MAFNSTTITIEKHEWIYILVLKEHSDKLLPFSLQQQLCNVPWGSGESNRA